MSDDRFARWQEQNREFLALAVDTLHERTQGHVADDDRAAAFAAGMDHAPALHVLAGTYALDPFEIDVVLLCFASEVDPRFRAGAAPAITVGFALEALDGAHWAALDDAATLRRSGILRIEPGPPLADAPLRLERDVLRFLMGFDPRPGRDPLLTLAPPPAPASARRRAHAEELAVAVRMLGELTGRPPAVELHGATEEDRIELAALCADAMDHALAVADVHDLPPAAADLDAVLQRWDRQGRLTGTALCLAETDAVAADHPGARAVARAVAATDQPLFLTSRRSTVGEPGRPVLRRAVAPMTAAERLEVWEACVARLREREAGGWAAIADGDLAALAGDFRLGSRSIERVTAELEAQLIAAALAEAPLPSALEPELRAGCAQAARAQLDPVADRVRTQPAHEIVLPEREAQQLGELEQRIRLHQTVTSEWGVGSEHDGGLTALFAGPSGTGKTHAAIVLAKRLGYDLYRVNVASVLSKYIGETEKNVDRIFDAARIGGVVLLFDEADALFGKRSEVRDSHDRYANVGTAHLLARLESTAVPTILTTNMKDAIDPAFLRRLRFVLDFPFPGAAEREEIWRTIYPERTPVGELEPERLAVLAATGGVIANIAQRGAYLAAAERSAIELRHLRESAGRELQKWGRELTIDERAAWDRSS